MTPRVPRRAKASSVWIKTASNESRFIVFFMIDFLAPRRADDAERPG
jgi:hypothetical protein